LTNANDHCRFSVNATISDGTSDTEVALFNEQLAEMIHISCRDLVITHGNTDSKVLPDQLRTLIGKPTLFHVTVKNDRTLKVHKAGKPLPAVQKGEGSTNLQALPPTTPDPKQLAMKKGKKKINA
jgi:hypothetical protein